MKSEYSDRFSDHFSKVYGERWPGLFQALTTPAVRANRNCFNGYSTYVMDEASIAAARALQVKPGDRVLDLCAAPGGKALILIEALQGRGELIANEISSARRRRLDEVVRTHVPSDQLKLVRITGFDGNQFGIKRANEFDRVLLDAPCSSERHLLEEDPSMKEWKISRTKQLAQRQYSLICSALLTLKPGGTLVYSTCSISPLENDGVIERLLGRKGEQVEKDSETGDLGAFEKTEHGFQLFPDRMDGIGPIYLSRLRKRS